jgi:microcystin-dependent protein
MAVSPGSATSSLIESRCPTFSWSQVEGAGGYELVVYRLGEEGEEPVPELRQTFAGSVSGWTPSLDRCLKWGGRYAWSVRVLGGEETSHWSPPSLFQVAAGPTEMEVNAALQVLRQFLVTKGGADVAARLEAQAEPPPAPDATRSLAVPRAVGTTQLSVDGGVVAESFSGDGSGLSNITASALATGTYANAVSLSNASNQFTGDGSALSNVAATTAAQASDLGCSGCVMESELGFDPATQAELDAQVTPVGAIIAFGGTVAPAGWLFCDGSVVARAGFADLYAVVGDAYGEGDGSTTFHLPDLRGRFARGVDGGVGRDPDAANRVASNNGGNVGDVVGSLQDDAVQGHRHAHSDPGHAHGVTDPGHSHNYYGWIWIGPYAAGAGANFGNGPTGSSVTGISINASSTNVAILDPAADGQHGTPRTSSETRPQNVSVNYIIKY